jgi:hypothetical protein
MHRSGTSVVARLLNILGVYLGPQEHILYPEPDNPKGFWEHRLLTGLNDEILKKFNSTWDKPPLYPPSWENSELLEGVRRKAGEVIQQDFHHLPLWGWKDPRTSLTLPFWRSVLGRMKNVICLRNPVDVAHSLEARDKFSPQLSYALWLRYVASSITYTKGQPRLFIFYEDLMSNPAGALKWLAKFVGKTATPHRTRTASIDVNRQLRHHNTSIQDVVSDRDVPFPVKALFMQLRLSIKPFSPPTLPDTLDSFAKFALEAGEQKPDLR